MAQLSLATEVLNVLASHWYFALILLVGTVLLMAWAIYQLSHSLHIAAAVTVGGLLVGATGLYNQLFAVSVTSIVLAVTLTLLYGAIQLRTMAEPAYKKSSKGDRV